MTVLENENVHPNVQAIRPDPMAMLLGAKAEVTQIQDEQAAIALEKKLKEDSAREAEQLKFALQLQQEEDEAALLQNQQEEEDMRLAKEAQEEEERREKEEKEYRSKQESADEDMAVKLHEDMVKALQKAATSGDVKSMGELIRKGAEPGMTSRFGDRTSLLHIAIRYNKQDILELLLTSKAPVDYQDVKGNTALHIASELNRTDMVYSLLNADAKVEIANQTGRTPVMEAARAGHFAPIKALLTKNANLYHKDNDNKMALHLVPFLRRSLKSKLHEMCGYGLLDAAQKGRISEVTSLIERGASVRLSDERNRTALHLAATNNHSQVVEYLLSKFAQSDYKDDNMQTVLHYAAKAGNVGIAQALLKAGADKEARDKAGKTPLDLCSPHSAVADVLRKVEV
mmetsp:Transcript_18053/g.27997  ORF Transcript_18053/g.27997 Transcript_18053/m.27997 type:complete len:400 (+) Transcript_18053:155-1354(+)|eukprot:CAMPEP_0184330616 /NCGR_PEP_ID=MMETSP1049-20130417/144777_1 /TAXON_ID=77928 /ORGANISM="Proteomonas sulcata, Strain CCMP704" /LENGTH=399 /DNA_ID=CAMNT_0026653063 /DNA_START=153 /DNA_END=1352 /DNA_ORIENTATION=+